jgi:hypothetical protein
MKKDWKVVFSYQDAESGHKFEDFLIIRARYCSKLDHAMILVDEVQITFNLGFIENVVEEYNEE